MASFADGSQLETIRTRQIAAFKNAINLNQPIGNVLVNEPVWKILVLDKIGHDIVSPLLSVKQLRDIGVTLHFLIGAKRESLSDVPAVYIVSPTDENVELIAEDLKKALYDSFYLNFISPLSRPRLEILATAAVHGACLQSVQKVVDQYLNFISLEDDLFVLKRYNDSTSSSFFTINDPSTSDNQMSSVIESIADGLFSVCATLGVVPIIRCPKNNAAEHVSKRLDQKLRDNLRDARNNLFAVESVRAGQLHSSRPLLLIADRSMDLATMLHHTWTYQALIHDVLDFEQNRIRLTEATGKRKEYEMNTAGTDKLWMKHKGSAFPLVAEAIQEDLEAYRSSEDEIKRLKHAMGMDGTDADAAMTSLLSDATSKLGSTVTSLPQLLEAKRLIDLHTNVATTLLDVIKQRKLDTLFEMEQKLLQNAALDKAISDFLADFSNSEDVLRVVLIYLLCSENVSQSEFDILTQFVRSKSGDDAALQFVKKMKSFSQLGRSSNHEEHAGAGTKTIGMFNKLLSHGSKFVMEGVKNLVPKKHNLPLTRMVDSLIAQPSSSTVGLNQMMGASSNSPADDLCFFDPKVMQNIGREATAARARLPPPQDVIVFIIGGGNYVEYQNLRDYGMEKKLERVTYGCTELVNPKQFTDELTRLGRGAR